MKYKLTKKMGLDIVSATDIANTIPWHGEFVPAEQVELILKLLEKLELPDWKPTGLVIPK